jgi:membrane-bound lytic murein transglycosylase B
MRYLMNLSRLFFILFGTMLMHGSSIAQQPFSTHPKMPELISYVQEKTHRTSSDIEQLFTYATPRPEILDFFARPSTSRPWYQFRQNLVSPLRIQAGAELWIDQHTVLKDVTDTYQVPSEYILAIIGIETFYGRNTGRYRVLDVLTTLALDHPRRSEYFRNELIEFLNFVEEERGFPLQYKGSFAGAMGWPQFMPSNMRKLSVDFDKNGTRDLWSSIPDITASVAHYLNHFLWKTPSSIKPFVVKLGNDVPDDTIAQWLENPMSHYAPLSTWKDRGVAIPENIPLESEALVFRLEVTPNVFEYYWGFDAFRSIWKYNNSIHYVMAVHELAQGIRKVYESTSSRP